MDKKRGGVGTPKQIAIEKGNYRPSRHDDELANSMKLDFVFNELPMPPDFFGDFAANLWTSTLSQANKVNGYISYIDLNVFIQYCLSSEELYNMRQKKIPLTIKTKTGRKVHPKYKIFQDKIKEVVLLAREFGFTPSARTRIQLEKSITPLPIKDKYTEGL